MRYDAVNAMLLNGFLLVSDCAVIRENPVQSGTGRPVGGGSEAARQPGCPAWPRQIRVIPCLPRRSPAAAGRRRVIRGRYSAFGRATFSACQRKRLALLLLWSCAPF